MNPSCILMCTNIPRGVNEDILIELFCIAGPIEDISISRNRSCFVIYEFPESVATAKEIFQDVLLYGRPLEMFDESDIKHIHEQQEQESADLQKEAAYAEVAKQYNPFYNPDSMTPNFRNNFRGHGTPRNFPPPQNLFDPTQNHLNSPQNQFNLPPFPNQFNPPPFPNQFNQPPPQNYSYGDNYDPCVPSRRWGSAPETNNVQSMTPDLDLFKSPYSQPVSRKNYEQSRKDRDDDDISDINYTNRFSNRHPDQSSQYDSSSEKKSFRDNNRYNSKHHSDSRSDYSNRQKSRGYQRSSYGRNDYRRNDRRNDYHQDKQHRNHRR